MFKKTDEKQNPGGSRERAGAPLRAGASEGAISIIGPGMYVQGDITTEGTVRIEGRVSGTVRAAKAVVVGREGRVEGNIITQDAVVGGQVVGTIIAESRLELQSSCLIEGEIKARAEHLKLDEGARFNGQIHMIDEKEPMRALPAESSARAGERKEAGISSPQVSTES